MSRAGAAQEADAGRGRGCGDAGVRRLLIVALVEASVGRVDRRAAAQDGELIGGALALAGRDPGNRMGAGTAGRIVRDAEIAHGTIRAGVGGSIIEGHAGRIGALEVEACDCARASPGVDGGRQAAGGKLRRSVQPGSVRRGSVQGRSIQRDRGRWTWCRPGARHEEQRRNEPQRGSGSVRGASSRHAVRG